MYSTTTQNFVEAILATFPDMDADSTITKAQLKDVSKKIGSPIPSAILSQRVSRGVYKIDMAIPSGKPNLTVVNENSSVSRNPSSSLVPVKDKNYVSFGNFSDLEKVVKSGVFYPVYISGPTGNGKSTMVEQVCAKHNKPLIRVNLNAMTDEEQLIGSKTLKNGNVEVVEGPVLIAMRNGYTLLLDEIDAGSSNALLCIQSILEGKPYYFKLNNEVITPAPGFNIIATANTKGKGSDDGRYIGTNILNEAFLERFAITFEQEYPTSKVEKKIILNLMDEYSCVDEEFAEALVKWADAIRRTFNDGGVDETITTRRMSHIVRAYSIFKDKDKVLSLCCNRFDSATKDAFIQLFERVSVPKEDGEVKSEEDTPIPF